MLQGWIFIQGLPLVPVFPIPSSCGWSQTIPIFLWRSFIFIYFINFNKKLWGNCFICRNCMLIFNIWWDTCTWFITRAILCSKTARRKNCFLQIDVLVQDNLILLEHVLLVSYILHSECYQDTWMIRFCVE